MPDRIRNTYDLPSISPIRDCDPATKTISHENINTTIVRSAVATVESVFLIPHFAKIEVIPANKAEPNANTIHIIIFLHKTN